MTQMEQLEAVEKSFVGIHENPLGSNKVSFNDWYIRKDFACDWCAISQLKAFNDAGLHSLLWGSLNNAKRAVAEGVKNWKALAIAKNSWYTDNYRRGDIVIFDWDGKRTATAHIGYIFNVSGNTAYTYEGNTSLTNSSDKTSSWFTTKQRDFKWITGVFRPAYDKVTSSAPTPPPTVTPPPKAVQPQIKKGAKGDAVKVLQTALNKFGYKLTVDGDFGALTDAAVRNFQKSYGLAVDGIVGSKTWQKLEVA
ncbi:MAG: peptidoglycan-binding protein [Oscillospiraceae bacterium]|jgi:hypothetical protein|nr:peptidoglycan-binding protein [Oscillospiraceae bacterium]